MVSLADLANFVTTIYTGVSRCSYYILMLSYVVGGTLVSIFSYIGETIIDFWAQFALCIQIVYEDYFIFIEDVTGKAGFFLTSCYNFLSVIAESCVNFVLSVRWCVLKIIEVIFCMCSVLKLWFFNIISAFYDGITMLKQGCLFLGSSIWVMVTLIPIAIIYCVNLIIQFFVNVFDEIYSFHLIVIQTVMFTMNNLISFFIDIPPDSVIGLFIGGVFFYLTLKHFMKICFFISRQLIKLYHRIEIISNILWTGQFLPSSPVTVNRPDPAREVVEDLNDTPQNQLNANILQNMNGVEKESNLCIVCQDRQRSVITLPCRHVCLCEVCCVHIKRYHGSCPVCRSMVRRTMKVYI